MILFKAPFTIGAQALYNTLQWEFFDFARTIGYVARALRSLDAILWSNQVSSNTCST